MNFLNSWLQGIVVAVIIATILELILPKGNTKKYIKVVLGVYIVFNIIAPIVDSFTDSNLELSSFINVEKYTKDIETYNESSNNKDINKSNDESIMQIYINNLKNDIKAKLEAKGYLIKDIQIKIDNSENYNIEAVNIYLKEKQKVDNNSRINEINKVEVKINYNEENTEKKEENESSVTEKEIKKIKKYVSDVYEVDEDKISLY